jgi:hypothetical protein
MLKEINEVRTNPAKYADKINKYISRIKCYDDLSDLHKKFYFQVDENVKINLIKGVEAFEKCISQLKSSQPILRPLEYSEDLCFPFPSEKPEISSQKEYLTETFIKMSREIKNKDMNISGFHYDNNINDAEISTILQIVDDNNSRGQRRSHILDKDAKYVGINIGKIKPGLFCIYLLFAT